MEVPLTRLSHLASKAQQELGRAAELPSLQVSAILPWQQPDGELTDRG